LRICSILTSLTSGGAEMLVANLNGQFVSAGHESIVVSLCDAAALGNSPEMEASIRHQIESEGGSFVSLGLGRRRNPLAGGVAMRKELRRIAPDIIHSHTARAMPMLAVRSGNAPVILTHHNSRLGFPTAMFRLFDRQVQAYVAISGEVRQLFEQHAQQPVVYIPNAAGTRFTTDAPRAAPRNPAFVLSVGAVSQQKNYQMVVEAAEAIRERGLMERLPVFRIAGNGPDIERLQLEVERRNLTRNVQFLGERSDVPDLMRDSDIYLNTSRYEGMPIALLEAMAMALPIVATDVAGNRELVQHGRTGLLAKAGDPVDLATSIASLLTTPKRYSEFSANALKGAEEFSIVGTARRHIAMYEEARRGEHSQV
jgi:glycosyltransferase involved in cell wall biosynthesis